MSSYPLPIVIHKYVPGKPTKAVGSRLAAHFKYNQYRTLGEQEAREDRSLFSAESDQVNRKDAVHDVMSHTSRSVNYHKLILSPGEHEHIDDFRQWTRPRQRVVTHDGRVVDERVRDRLLRSPEGRLPHGGDEFLRHAHGGRHEEFHHVAATVLRQQGREHSNFTFYQEQEQFLHLLNEQDQTPIEYGIDRDLERSF